jgi:GWxTD domain-containing protein
MKIFLIIGTLLLISCVPASQYQRQLTQLPKEQRQDYKILKYSIEAVGDKNEIEEFNKIPSTDTTALRQFEESFWKKRDPNPLTPENEREIEFEKRLKYVLENFSTNSYYRPWDERGDAYLKLGEPNERKTRLAKKYSYLPYSQTKVEEVPEEEWLYIFVNSPAGPLKFRFQQDLIRGFISVPESSDYFRDEKRQQQMLTWASQVEQKPMQYFYDYGKEELKYAFGLTPFLMRETPNIYDIYLTINAPAQKLVTPTLDSLHYTWKVLVQDENYERLFEDSSEGISYLGSKNGELKNLVVIDQKELNLKAGTYIITSELVNSDRNKGGLLQSKLVLPTYKFPKDIELSYAILAKEIRVADSSDSKFVRNGLVIKPWVTSIFNPAEIFWLYFEIYNMPLDREGKSHFTIRYYLQDVLSNKKYLLSEKSVRQEQRDYAIVQSFSDSLFQAAKIPVNTGKDYVLLTEIKDEIMGKELQSLSAMFKFKKSGS